VTIYSNDSCVYCHLAKRLLAERGIPYREVNLAMDAEGRRALNKRTGRLTFRRSLSARSRSAAIGSCAGSSRPASWMPPRAGSRRRERGRVRPAPALAAELRRSHVD
jgi:hypothetical protein